MYLIVLALRLSFVFHRMGPVNILLHRSVVRLTKITDTETWFAQGEGLGGARRTAQQQVWFHLFPMVREDLSF